MRNSLSDNPNFASLDRYNAMRFIIIGIISLFTLRLVNLQLWRGSEYKFESEAQAIKKVRVEPFRGNMFDRNGKMMVHNEPSFSVFLTPNDYKQESTPLLASILNVDTSFISQYIKAYQGFSPFSPIKISRDVEFQTIAAIQELTDFLPGVEIGIESKRLYDFDGTMAHMLGYTREISSTELKKMSYYQPGDIIGKNGLEKEYESFLRGREGVELIAVNKYGQKVSDFNTDIKKNLPSNNGFDLHLSIDKDLQTIAEKALEGKRGAVVVIDPRNGEVLVHAVKPDYDPRKFNGKVKAEYYNSLRDDEGKPLLNRAVSSAYPPGSSWKMVIATGALTEGVIDIKTQFTCGGGYNYGNRFFKCMHNHGTMNVVQAIQVSCNSFFYQTALRLGLPKIIEYGQLFGFGQKTGIDLSSESKGNYPDIPTLTKLYKGYVPNGIVLNYGIGQGEILVTPIQMAQYAATLANKGTIYQPHVVKSIFNNLTKQLGPVDYKKKELKLNPDVMEIIHQGMFAVVNIPGGTANHVKIPGIDVCGKTSTAQNPHGQDHGWFICFAPRKNPTIAMAIIIENRGTGGSVAAPIAKELLNAYFFSDSLKSKLKAPKIYLDLKDSAKIITSN